MEQKIATPVQKGLMISLILIVYGLVLYFTNQFGNKTLGYLQYAVLIGGVIWSCIYFAKQMNGNVTFGNVFAHGFKTTAFITALMAVYTFISIKFIFPDIVDKTIEIARTEMASNKDLSEDQVNQLLEMTRNNFTLIAISAILLMFAIYGAVASLIGAAIAKKNPQTPFAQPQI